MPANLLATFSMRISAALTPTNPVNNGAAPGPAMGHTQKINEGTAAGQADTAYGKQLTVPPNPAFVEFEPATNDGDPDGNGDPVALTRIVKLALEGIAGQTGKFILGGATGSAFSGPFNGVGTSVNVIAADDQICYGDTTAAGYTVAAGQKFRITQTGTTQQFVNITVIGS